MTEKEFALLQFIHSTHRGLAVQFKFQIPNYALLIDKSNAMEALTAKIGMEFNRGNDDMIKSMMKEYNEKVQTVQSEIELGLEQAHQEHETSTEDSD